MGANLLINSANTINTKNVIKERLSNSTTLHVFFVPYVFCCKIFYHAVECHRFGVKDSRAYGRSEGRNIEIIRIKKQEFACNMLMYQSLSRVHTLH